MRKMWLVALALGELVRYDLTIQARGFRQVHRSLAGLPVGQTPSTNATEEVSAAMTWALALYWKPVHCLQRSVATVRLLRRESVAGRLVIGFRENPFFSHAWVEVAGRVFNESQRYREELHVLEMI